MKFALTLLISAVLAATKAKDGAICTLGVEGACSTTGSCCAKLSTTSGGSSADNTNGICVIAGTTATFNIVNPKLGTTFTAANYYVMEDCHVNG